MLKKLAILLSLTLTFSAGAVLPSKALSLSDLDGNAFLFNPKTKQFLGNISSNRFDDESICNQFGDFGGRFEDFSILNRFGDYGDQFSDFSAFNPNAEYPPVIFLNNWEPVAIVTNNPRFDGIHPGALFGVICGQQ